MRVWFITGASRGFGALIAEAALKAGDAVVATARDPATVTARLGQHERLLAARLDVTSETEAHAAAGEAVKTFGRIDILINNAGYGLLGAIEEANAAETQRLFGTNVFGLLGVTRAVLPHMRRQRAGHIINISSVGGRTSTPGLSAYPVSYTHLDVYKRQVVNLTRAALPAMRAQRSGQIINISSVGGRTSTPGLSAYPVSYTHLDVYKRQVVNLTRAALPAMRAQRSGQIINISSVGGYAGYPGWGVYGATKFAVEGISEALAAEVAPLGIKVTVVEPGFFRTDFLDESSLSRTAQQIEDYHASVGKTRAVAADFNHGQRGDPRKLAGAMLKLVNADNPPLRLPLGSDTVERIETKNAFVARELAEWRAVATSTDFTDEA